MSVTKSRIKGRRIMGIEFAPLRVPLERRLQTMTVAFFLFSLLFAMFYVIPLFIYMLIFTKYWFVPTLYTAWIVYDRRTPYQGGRKWYAIRNWRIWHYYRDYFPIGLVKTAQLPSDKNYLFCVYPHGIACAASFLNFQSNANNFDQLYPGIDTRIVALNANYRIPFSKDILLACGGIAASEESLLNCLQSKPGASCVLMPGGASEALCSFPGKCTIILKNRRGFVRTAIKTGASLVPVFSFGENEIFDQMSGELLLWLQNKLRCVIGLSLCVLKGRGFFQYTFGLLPHRKPIVTVVGKPIEVLKISNPSEELITELHTAFEEALLNLFNEYKSKYHPLGSNAEIKIV